MSKETEDKLYEWGRWCRTGDMLKKLHYPGIAPYAKMLSPELSGDCEMWDDEGMAIDSILANMIPKDKRHKLYRQRKQWRKVIVMHYVVQMDRDSKLKELGLSRDKELAIRREALAYLTGRFETVGVLRDSVNN